MNTTADVLLEYLSDLVYNPARAKLETSVLPREFRAFGEQLKKFAQKEQQLEEQSVLQAKERSRLRQYITFILEGTSDILIIFDTAGKAVFASRTFMKISPHTSPVLIRGKSFRELLSSLLPEKCLAEISEMLTLASVGINPGSMKQCVDMKHDGNPYVYNVRISPMMYEDGVVVGIMVVMSREPEDDTDDRCGQEYCRKDVYPAGLRSMVSK